jgi:outer membrane protein assembly factor BamD (BamD/ComL family)
VLDAARTALARGDANDALKSLAEHEKTYPAGALAEEREALYVRSLVEAGRKDDARARASRFRARWPRSLLLPAVEASVADER